METTPDQRNLLAPQTPPTWVRYRVLTLLTVVAAIAYLCGNAVGVAESSIREDLGLSLSEAGWFMGMFFWTYAICSVPAAVVGRILGPRLALTTFAIVWSIATAAIGLAPATLAGMYVLSAAQLCNGASQAGIFPASFNSISQWIPLNRRTLACAMPGMGMQVGAIVAASLTGYLLKPLGWRWVFGVYAVPGIIWGFIFLLWFRNEPENDGHVNEVELEIIRAGREDVPTKDHQLGPTPWLAIGRCGCCVASRHAVRPVICFLPVGFPRFCRRPRASQK